MAPITAIALGVVTLGIGLAIVPVDLLIHQPGLLPGHVTGLAAFGVGAGVGALLAARRPRNPIGWLLLAIFLLAAVPARDYSILDYRLHHGTLPLGSVAVVLGADWPMLLVLIAITLWLFPDGQLPRGRWPWVAVVLVGAGVLLGLAGSAGGVVAVAGHDIHIGASGNLTGRSNLTGAWAVVQYVAAAAVLASWLAWLVVQVPRYWRSAGERRQQLKWLYSGVIVWVISLVIAPHSPGNSVLSQMAYDLGELAAAALPVCIGVAVLKYRLYQIDRIISRVISYAIISAILAGLFAGLVVLTSDVLPFKTPVAVAAATLVVAALFNPLRRRVQRAVDRRFNRARYNAEAVVAAFTERLRGTVDLDAMQGDLVDAIQHAFEPAHVSVWLAPRGQHESTPLGARPRHST